MGPLAKWVDNHIVFRVPQVHLADYNAQCAEWYREIQVHGGHRQEGSQFWYRGKNMPDDSAKEFDKDCGATLYDLAGASPRPATDQESTYTDMDIDKLSTHLGIRWEVS